MCGIYALSKSAGEIDQGLVERATDSLQHRGPDNRGVYLSSDKKTALGYRRLSIIDTTQRSQPILHNEDKTLWISYNGEIYNFPKLKKELLEKGHRFYTNTDTETILHLYEEEGPSCVKKLQGIFAIAIYDQKKERLFLARDHLGVKPLYYTVQNGKFAAASEIKALLEDPTVSREINYDALSFYFNFRYVPDPLTMFQGIYKVPAGHYLLVRRGQIEDLKSYWEIPAPFSNGRESEEFYVDRVRELVTSAVREQLLADVPLGAFLSGGVDSTIIVGLMSKFMNKPVQTFSIGFEDWPDFDESRFARLVSKRFGTEHQELQFKPEQVGLLPQVVYYLDEPLADPAALPTAVLAQAARKKVKVVLTGEGADELFRGYERDLPKAGFSDQSFLGRLVDCLPDFKGRSRLQAKVNSPDFRLVNNVLVALRPMGLFSQAVRGRMATSLLGLLKKDLEHCRGWDYLSCALYLEAKVWLTGDPLMKADKMTMASSLEARVPFLDYHLVELAAKIPSAVKLGDGTSKYLLRRAFGDLLPQEILNRPKKGFELPLQIWLNNELKSLVDKYLFPEELQKLGLFNTENVSEMLQVHRSGRIDYKYEIWALLTFVLWHKIYLQGESWEDLILL